MHAQITLMIISIAILGRSPVWLDVLSFEECLGLRRAARRQCVVQPTQVYMMCLVASWIVCLK